MHYRLPGSCEPLNPARQICSYRAGFFRGSAQAAAHTQTTPQPLAFAYLKEAVVEIRLRKR